jgi:hypothetical protein
MCHGNTLSTSPLTWLTLNPADEGELLPDYTDSHSKKQYSSLL